MIQRGAGHFDNAMDLLTKAMANPDPSGASIQHNTGAMSLMSGDGLRTVLDGLAQEQVALRMATRLFLMGIKQEIPPELDATGPPARFLQPLKDLNARARALHHMMTASMVRMTEIGAGPIEPPVKRVLH